MTRAFPRSSFVLCALVLPLAASRVAPAQAQLQVRLDAQGQRVTKRFEQVLRDLIQAQGGQPVHVRVTPSSRAGQGMFSSVAISGGATKLKNLFASQFQLQAQNVQVDVPTLFNQGKVRTLRSQTRLRVVISENDLTRMLARGHATRDMGLRVKYVGDKMRVSGNLNYTFLNGPVSGLAKLRQTADHDVYLDILSLQLRGIEVPGFLKSQLESRINPVINYSNLPFNPPFRHLRVAGDKAILST